MSTGRIIMVIAGALIVALAPAYGAGEEPIARTYDFDDLTAGQPLYAPDCSPTCGRACTSCATSGVMPRTPSAKRSGPITRRRERSGWVV
jgi:hypothetical protein